MSREVRYKLLQSFHLEHTHTQKWWLRGVWLAWWVEYVTLKFKVMHSRSKMGMEPT